MSSLTGVCARKGWRFRIKREELSLGRFFLSVLTVSALVTLHARGEAATIRTDSGLAGNTLARNDDSSTGAVNLGFTINYLGTSRSTVFVNNNGNLTFGSSFSTFTPSALSGTSRDMIAPFWADADTDPYGDAVTYGTATINGHSAFAANYVNVDYYASSSGHGTQLNDFQVVLFDRSDVNAADFDIEFNYEDINWETGDASGGSAGLGGTSARAGFGNTANTISFEIAGAGTNGAYLDTNASTGLANTSNIGVTGRRYFLVCSGSAIVPGRDDLMLIASGDAQKSVATVLDAHLIASTGDMGRAISELYLLSSNNAKQTALEQLDPVVNGEIAQVSFATADQFLATIGSRLDAVRGGPVGGAGGVATGNMFKGVGAWIQGLGNHVRQKARNGLEGYQANMFGTAWGADRACGAHVRVGLSGGHSFADINSKAGGGSETDVHSYHAALYASYGSGPRQKTDTSHDLPWRPQVDSYYVDAIAGVSHHEYDGQRDVRFGTINRLAKADYAGQQYSVKLEGGIPLKHPKTKDLEVTPLASFEYNYLHIHDYTEQGADSLNLSVESQGYHTFKQGLGLQIGYPLLWKRFGTLTPKLRGMWLYDYNGDKTQTTASFTGGGASFRTVGARPAQHAFQLGSELAFLSSDSFSLTAHNDLELKDQFVGDSYQLTLRYEF